MCYKAAGFSLNKRLTVWQKGDGWTYRDGRSQVNSGAKWYKRKWEYPLTTRKEILNTIRTHHGPMEATQIADAINCTQNVTTKHLQELKNKDKVECQTLRNTQLWSLTDV